MVRQWTNMIDKIILSIWLNQQALHVYSNGWSGNSLIDSSTSEPQLDIHRTWISYIYVIYIYTHIIYIYIIINGSLMSAYVGDPESRSFLKFNRDWRPLTTPGKLSLAVKNHQRLGASRSLVPFFQSRNWNWRRYFPWRLLPRSFHEAMNVFQK